MVYNFLRTARMQPIAVPLWYGCEVPGTDHGAIALRDGLEQRWLDGHFNKLLRRLEPPITIPVEDVPRARARLHQRDLVFLDAIDNANELLADAVDQTIKREHLPIVLGGDHALAMGSIAGAVRNAEKVGVLWIDTHPDINTPEGSLSGHIHGMPLAVALGTAADDLPRSSKLAGTVPMIQPDQIAYLGIRDIDLFEENTIKRRDIFARTMDEWNDDGIINGLEAALAHLMDAGVDAIHLSFDVDVLDPGIFPGTGTRYPGGLTIREASQVLRYLGLWTGLPIRSMDFVELNPMLDPTGISTQTALHLLATALGQRMLDRG
ncbi:MAG: arginase [Thermomicrobiales bacterium]|nr:arginase [Thermomicrobiales bacterium]MCO5224441.1 arginase [Thermomicrobiales bacterium]MCO5226363.1 arginase [Thermomicrobiales bacterium]MCO5229398.1 arginase [Thermomicrobiales bacterium]